MWTTAIMIEGAFRQKISYVPGWQKVTTKGTMAASVLSMQASATAVPFVPSVTVGPGGLWVMKTTAWPAVIVGLPSTFAFH